MTGIPVVQHNNVEIFEIFEKKVAPTPFRLSGSQDPQPADPSQVGKIASGQNMADVESI